MDAANCGPVAHPAPSPGTRSPPGLPTGPQDPLSAFEMTRLALLKMYNQSTGMGAEGIRPPLPGLPNMPLPPDMPGLHQDKVTRHCPVMAGLTNPLSRRHSIYTWR